jgi:hypothetical protein
VAAVRDAGVGIARPVPLPVVAAVRDAEVGIARSVPSPVLGNLPPRTGYPATMSDSAKQTHQTTHTMAAAADLVLNTAADLKRASAWIPASVRVADRDEVEVTAAGQAVRYQVRLRADEQVLEWHPVDRDGWPGSLRVADRGAGSSEAELRVDTTAEVDADRVRSALDRALGALAAEVAQNFTDG